VCVNGTARWSGAKLREAIAPSTLCVSGSGNWRSISCAIAELHRKTEGNGQSLVNARHLVGREPADPRFQTALVN
jgi:hypothetical protein